MFSRTGFFAIVLLLSMQSFADDFSDFRIPEHSVLSLTGEVDLNGSVRNSEQQSDYDSHDIRGDIGGSLYWLRDSDRFRSRVSASLSADGSLRRVRDENSPEYWNYSRNDYLQQRLSASWNNRVYPWTIPLGVSGYVSGSIATVESWSLHESEYPAEDGNIHVSDGEDRHEWNARVSVSYAVGYGRVRDATAIFDVFILEDRLIEKDALTGELQGQTRRDIAALYLCARRLFPALRPRRPLLLAGCSIHPRKGSRISTEQLRCL
jgi:hypothetical protein